MLDAFGLINMNGRLYDPVLGRMLSPDNYVSSAGSTQAFNRYSYALNNPLIITDPSGDNPALIAMIAYSAIVGGLSSAQNGDGFLQGFGVGLATGALSYGVGAALGPVVGGGTRLALMANAGIHTAIASGITYGAGALINNTAFNWKGYGLNIATSMAFAGLSYQKPSTQYINYSREDLEAAGLQTDLGSEYGMSGRGPKKGRYYFYDPPKNKGGYGLKLKGGGSILNDNSPFIDFKLNINFGVAFKQKINLLGFNEKININFFSVDLMTWNWNSSSPLNIKYTPYESAYSSFDYGAYIAGGAISYDWSTNQGSFQGHMGMLELNRNTPARFTIFDIGSQYGFGFNVKMTANPQKVLSEYIKVVNDYNKSFPGWRAFRH